MAGGFTSSGAETTPEPFWKLMRDAKDNPDILAEIEQCKEDFFAQHPGQRPFIEHEEEVEAMRPAPTRELPNRKRATTERFTFAIFGVQDPLITSVSIAAGYRELREATHSRCRAMMQMLPDFTICCD